MFVLSQSSFFCPRSVHKSTASGIKLFLVFLPSQELLCVPLGSLW